MSGQIIFLHGASSSGKSTLARALQAAAPVPFWHISIDHLRDSGVWPLERVRQGDFEWSAMRDTVFAGFHGSVAAYAEARNNVILEHILDTPGWAEDLQRRFVAFDVMFVGVHCPLDILEAREIARGDRRIGSAAEDFATIHKGQRYDLEVDGTADISKPWPAC